MLRYYLQYDMPYAMQYEMQYAMQYVMRRYAIWGNEAQSEHVNLPILHLSAIVVVVVVVVVVVDPGARKRPPEAESDEQLPRTSILLEPRSSHLDRRFSDLGFRVLPGPEG